MIRTEDDFEAALDEATILFDEHPEEGGAAHKRLMDLLAQIAAYRPEVVLPSGDPVSHQRADLARSLKRFESQMPRRYTDHWHTLVSEI